ncbi:MAG: hypothetical protein RLY86_3742 [Pseudomonadota bacterium]|jgi:uncharacterized protein (DUF885 family)
MTNGARAGIGAKVAGVLAAGVALWLLPALAHEGPHDGHDHGAPVPAAQVAQAAGQMPAAAAKPAATAEDAKLRAFLDAVWQRNLERNPTLRTRLGLPGDHSRWTPVSDAFGEETAALARQDLERLRAEIAVDVLSAEGRLNHRMFTYIAEQTLRQEELRYDRYAFTRLSGPHTFMASFLASTHRVRTVNEAEDYIARLTGMPAMLTDSLAAMQRRVEGGVVPPAFNFPSMATAARAVVTGAPFDGSGKDSPLWQDITGKIAALDAPAAEKERLAAAARAALVDQVGPAYRAFADAMAAIGQGRTGADGVWALPKGAALYRDTILTFTTVDLAPDAIHETGLKEVARIQEEMRGIMRQVTFQGDLAAFFEHLKTDPKFYFPQTEEGKAAYIAQATAMIRTIEGRLDDYFGVKPKAPIEVRAVEKFRENSTAGAFYQAPSLDGTRPGIFYANMSDMTTLPTWDLETLAYHEGIPGHHMQIAIAQELTGIPEFRRTWNNSAYAEGWALYSEYLAKEMGFFTDPYADAGRLSAELFRAVRLVVDTGLHARKWTREQAIAYMNANLPNVEADNVREVERYLNNPGQALAYKIGMIEIQRMRAEAEAALGDRFDIRGFHDTLLANGALPLSLLEEVVEAWVASRKG